MTSIATIISSPQAEYNVASCMIAAAEGSLITAYSCVRPAIGEEGVRLTAKTGRRVEAFVWWQKRVLIARLEVG